MSEKTRLRFRRPAASATAKPAAGFRPDIEGLRAIAVGIVLWYHAGLAGLPGGFAGVDVFFVISGFLITGQLVREVEANGRISLPRFYARRAKRLFPAAATVLLTTAVLTWVFLPRIYWRDFGGDIAASAGYFINWRLAARAVDYLAEDVTVSPVQHFWSLAVEEQFYIVWPVLLLLLGILIARRRLPVRPTMALGLAAIVLPSLAWSIHLTETDSAPAYFVTTTRLWELGVGALVAVGAGVWARLAQRAAAAIAWSGLVLLTTGVLLQSAETPWPGFAALVPVLGTAGVILGGFAAGPTGPSRVLGVRPMVWVGGLSYSLYLWHWPLIVAAMAAWNGLAAWQGALVALASVLPAWATHRYIENPLRFNKAVSSRVRVALAMGAACSLLGVGAGLAVAAIGQRDNFGTVSIDEAVGGADLPGTTGSSAGTNQSADGASATAAPLPAAIDMHPTAFTPAPLQANADVPELYKFGCQVGEAGSTVFTCERGVAGSDKVVAVLGDSKMVQWMPALEQIAKQQGWSLRTYFKARCPWTATATLDVDHPYPMCHKWGEAVLADLTGPHKPMVVITSSIRVKTSLSGDKELAATVDGFVTYWSALGKAGVPLVAIADTPQPGLNVYRCVDEHPDNLMTACRGNWNEGIGTPALKAAVSKVPTSRFIDLNPWVCPQEKCWPVIGKVLVYRQGSHLTATFTGSLAKPMAGLLLPAIAELTKD